MASLAFPWMGRVQGPGRWWRSGRAVAGVTAGVLAVWAVATSLGRTARIQGLFGRGAVHPYGPGPVGDVGMWALRDGECLAALAPHPDIVVYNRMPKAGSSTMITMLRSSGDHFVGGNNRVAFELMLSSMTRLEKMYLRREDVQKGVGNAVNRWRQMEDDEVEKLGWAVEGLADDVGKGVLYIRHLYLHPDLRFRGEVPVYFQLLRNPVARAVSRYYYSHDEVDEGREARAQATPQMMFSTMDMCLEASGEDASPRCSLLDPPATEVDSRTYASMCWSPRHEWNQWPDPRMPPCWEHLIREEMDEYYVRWMCGFGPECSDPHSEAAYMTARKHMRSYFVVVGVLEEMGATVRALRRALPRLFTDAVLETWADMERKGTKRNPSSYRVPGERVFTFLEEKNTLSTRMWEEARDALLRADSGCATPPPDAAR